MTSQYYWLNCIGEERGGRMEKARVSIHKGAVILSVFLELLKQISKLLIEMFKKSLV